MIFIRTDHSPQSYAHRLSMNTSESYNKMHSLQFLVDFPSLFNEVHVLILPQNSVDLIRTLNSLTLK